MTQPSKDMNDKLELDELQAWSLYIDQYFLEVLNGDKSLAEALEDIKSFRNSKWYTGSNPKYLEISEE